MRAFALAVLLAVALLPKTAWIVRNQVAYLAGGYGNAGETVGVATEAIAPRWPFRKGVLRDPAAAALMDDEGPTAEERLDRIQPALDDSAVRAMIRPFVLRRSFTSILVSHLGDPQDDKMRRVAARLLPLATEGERADEGNAFYPSCAWVLLTVLERPREADAALARAAHCPRYDDESVAEGRFVADAIERQFGYRGNLIRIEARGDVLLPQYAALRRLTGRIADGAPMDDPRRRDLVRLGETMMETGPSRITVYAGRAIAYAALGRGEPPQRLGPTVEARARAFGTANPGFDAERVARRIVATEFDFAQMIDGFQRSLGPSAVPAGASLLVALVGALALSAPQRRPTGETPGARVRRAPWAWLALVPAAFLERRDIPLPAYLVLFVAVGLSAGLARWRRGEWPAAGLGGAIAGSVLVAASPYDSAGAVLWTLGPVLWASALLVPPKGRGMVQAVLLATGVWMAFGRVGRPLGLEAVGLGASSFVLALRGALPQGRTRGWVPAALALAYLGAVGVELAHDAQLARVVQRFDDDAARFREARGI